MPMLMDPRKLAVTLTALLRVAVSLSALPLASAAGPSPYTNHTVGGPAGWFFDPATNSSAANYSSWALRQSFFLGDFLIFRTNTNVSVIQTYNETTYRICDASGDDGASVYSDGSGAGGFGAPAVVAVPLTEAGDSYYFSDANDGIQCVHGMRFQISVGHGNGLPPDLSRPPPPPYADPTTAPPAGDGTEGTNQREEFHNGGGRKGIGGGGAGMPILVAAMMLLM